MSERKADYPIDPMFLTRWSPRAFDGKPITREELMTVLEAGRFAPSAFNVQPWRFLYAQRDTPAWPTFLGLLIEWNRAWAHAASALVFIASQRDMPPAKDGTVKPSRSHSFDAGASFAMMALQASRMGLFAHGMTGFDPDRAPIELRVPDSFRVDAVFALGHLADKSVLSAALAAREEPSTRKPLSELAFEGGFETPK